MRIEMLVIPPRVGKSNWTLAIHQGEGMRIRRMLSTQGIEVYVNARVMPGKLPLIKDPATAGHVSSCNLRDFELEWTLRTRWGCAILDTY